MSSIITRLARLAYWYKVKIAIKRAKRLAKATGRPHYVVKDRGKIVVLDKAYFKYLRQHGYFPLSITASDIKRIAIYYTR